MSTCDLCGNDYDRTFTVTMSDGSVSTFDSFECAIHLLAPVCDHCGCKIVGHGIQADGVMYCCAHCARRSGVQQARDRA